MTHFQLTLSEVNQSIHTQIDHRRIASLIIWQKNAECLYWRKCFSPYWSLKMFHGVKRFSILEWKPRCWVFLLFSVSCRMVMEEGGQRDRGRGTPVTAGAQGRQVFMELGEWFLTPNISLTWPLQGTQVGVFLNPVISLFVLCFKMQEHVDFWNLFFHT